MSRMNGLTDDQILAIAQEYRYAEPDACGYDFGRISLLRFAGQLFDAAANAARERGEQGAALLHAAADECMSPDQRNLFDELGADDADVYERLFRCVAKRIDASAPMLSGCDNAAVVVRAKTVHRRIDALCEAANTAGADYFDASTSMLIATRDLLTALGFPHRMAEPKEYGGSCEDCKWSAISGGGLCDGCAQAAEPKGVTEEQRESKERAEFEAYMTGKGYVCKTHFGGYVAGDVASKWDVWQARALLAPPPQAAEPKRLTEKQRDAIEHAIPVLMDAKQFGDVVTLRALLSKGE